jgi:hypothetical protein
MNDYPPFPNRGGGFYSVYHDGGPSALTWTIFALQILTLLGVFALLGMAAARMRFAFRPGPPPRFGARGFGRPPRFGGPGGHDPLEVVRMRYARGELDREQYLQASRDLGGIPEEEAPTIETG